MKTPNTVITITPSRKLLLALQERKYPYWESVEIGTGDGATRVSITARLCTARSGGYDFERYPERGYEVYLTGGVVISAVTPKPYYGNAKTYTTRLGPGWSKMAFYRAVTRVWLQAATETRLFAARDALCRAVEGRDVSELEYDDEFKFQGHSIMYDAMTAEDIAFWRDYFGL